MRFSGGLLAWCGLAAAAMADPCSVGARVDFPLSVVLEDEARGYLIAAITRKDIPPDPDPVLPYASAFAAVLRDRSSEMPLHLADLPYLILLASEADYPDPLYSLTYMAPSTVLPEIIAAAEAQGLTPEAGFLRVPMTVYPDWTAGPSARRQALLSQGPSRMQELAMQFAARSLRGSAPRILAATEALIASDPRLAADYEAQRTGADADRRVQYLVWRLVSECLAGWWSPADADAAFAGMAPAQADILLLHSFLAESFNGSTHQYFHNSSGTMAPQLAALLDRIGLPDHAAGVRQGMAVFPAPYPRDTDARREIMATFSRTQDEALYAVTVWADDGRILDAMVRLAEEAGLMPQ